MFHQIEMGEEERPQNSFNPNPALNSKSIITKKNACEMTEVFDESESLPLSSLFVLIDVSRFSRFI